MSDSTARIGLQIAGTAVGAFFGGPVGAAIGGSIGGYAGQQLFPPDVPDGPRLDDLSVQTSSYGAPIPVAFGLWRLAGNVIWTSGIQEHSSEESVGKGGGPSRTTYSYTASFAVAFGEGPATAITRIWGDTKLLYDASKDATDPHAYANLGAYGVESHQSGLQRIYLGTETQEPDPAIEAIEGAGNVPGHRGLIYIVFEDLDLEDFGNRIPSVTAEVAIDSSVERTHSGGYEGIGIELEDSYFALGRYKDDVQELVGQDSQPSYNYDTQQYEIRREKAFANLNGGIEWRKAETLRADGLRQNTGEPYAADAEWVKHYPGAEDIGPVWYGWSDPDEGDEYQLYCGWGAIGMPGDPNPDGELLDECRVLNTPVGVYAFLRDNGHATNVRGKPAVIIKAFGSGYAFFKPPTDDDVERPEYRWMAYDPVNQRIVAQYGADPDHGDVIYVLDKDLGVVDFYTGGATGDNFASVWDDQVLVADNDGNIEEYQLTDSGLETKADFYGSVSSSGPDIMHWGRDVVMSTDHGVIRDTNAPNDYPLSSVIDGICERAGLAPTDYDTSQVAKTVTGFAHTRPVEAKQDLQPILQGFAIDMVESDGQLKFIPRGGDPVATIPLDDLGATEAGGEKNPDAVVVTRKQELELPRRIGVQYSNPDNRFETGEQYASRVITEAVNDQTHRLPVAITNAQAIDLAQQILLAEWVGRDSYAWATPIKWAYLDPGDIVTIESSKATYRARITGSDVAVHAYAQWQGVREDAASYQPSAVAESGSFTPLSAEAVGPTTFHVLDIPLLRERDDAPGYYIAAAGLLSGWRGSDVFRETIDGGWEQVAFVQNGSSMGTAIHALGNARSTVWDEGNSLTVEITGPELTSATALEVLDGANHGILGDEIIAWRDAQDNGDGTYTLTGLLRGRRGTEWAIPNHQTGDRFVALTTALARYAMETDRIGREQKIRAASVGGDLAGVDGQTVSGGGAALTPYAPGHLSAGINADGNLELAWVRRVRYGGEWRDRTDVPLVEDSEKYEIDLFDGQGNLIATQETTTSSLVTSTTTAAKAVIYQISDRVGRGNPAEIQL